MHGMKDLVTSEPPSTMTYIPMKQIAGGESIDADGDSLIDLKKKRTG